MTFEEKIKLFEAILEEEAAMSGGECGIGSFAPEHCLDVVDINKKDEDELHYAKD